MGLLCLILLRTCTFGRMVKLNGMRLRRLFHVILGVTSLAWLSFLFVLLFSDRCQTVAYTEAICDKWNNGVIDGPLCSTLCKKRTPLLYYCSDNGEYGKNQRVYQWDNLTTKVNKANLATSEGNGDEILYSVPREASSVDSFRDLLSSQLTVRLGAGDHADLIIRIMSTADHNKDGIVSLAEARTMWSLLQHNEFLILLIFQDTDFVPTLKGFCGDMYSYYRIENTHLYEIPKKGILKTLFPNSYTWRFPHWNLRAKIAVGLLEFTMEAYEHGSQGPFYMCGLSEVNIGYTRNHDVKIGDVSELLPRATLSAYLQDHTCSKDEDCAYSQHCVTRCNTTAKKCTDILVYPDIHRICSILEKYLTLHLPLTIKGEFSYLIHRCFKLDCTAQNFPLHHSLVVNEMKSLLWKVISDKTS